MDGYRAAPGPADGFVVDSAEVGSHLGYAARLHVTYTNDALVYEDAAGFSQSERTRLVGDQLRLHPLLALGLWERALVFASVPLDVVMDGQPLGDLPTATGTGLGDVRLGARALALRADPLQLAVQLDFTLPTGKGGREDRPGVAGDEGVTVHPELIAQLGSAPLAWMVNLGARWRKDASFAGVRFEDALMAGTALAWTLLPHTLRGLAELRLETPLAHLGDTSSSRLDAQLGLEFEPARGWVLGAAGGSGLARGYGEPDLRVVLSVGYNGAFGVSRAHEPAPIARAAANESHEPAPQPAPVSARATARVQVETPASQPPPRPPATPTPAPAPVTPPPPVVVAPPAAATPRPAPPPPPAATTAQWIATLASTPNADPDADRVPNKRDRCPLAPGRKSARGCPKGHRVDLAEGRFELLQPPRFDADSARLNPRLQAYVDELAATLRANLSMRVILEAHSADGDGEATLALTQKRAAAIKARFVQRGVAPERVEAYGCGQSRPLAPNNVPWGRKKNERLELHLLDPVPSSGVHSTQGCVAAE